MLEAGHESSLLLAMSWASSLPLAFKCLKPRADQPTKTEKGGATKGAKFKGCNAGDGECNKQEKQAANGSRLA